MVVSTSALLARPALCTIHNMSSREIIKRLKRAGWFKVGQVGSHVQLKHDTKPGRVTVPHPEKDVPAGTIGSIEKQSGVKLK